MEIKAKNDEVIVINLLPEEIFSDCIVVDKCPCGCNDKFTAPSKESLDIMNIDNETPAIIRVFKDKIEVETVTPRILDECSSEMLIDFKRRKRKFAFDDLFLMSDTMKKIMGK